MGSNAPEKSVDPRSATGGNSNVMKRADQRSSITILVLGDESVGKSSLISTFVSRYFSEHGVPGIMTRVRLPPDPHSLCITTIVDSQAGDVALLEQCQYQQQQLRQRQQQQFSNDTRTASDETSFLLPPPLESGTNTTSTASSSLIVDAVDSIVLVYDLDRVDTFTRLENHWLPLIEKCYEGKIPVIIAENKLDLFRPTTSVAGISATAQQTDEQVALARMKRQQIVTLMQRFPFVRQCIKCSAKNLVRVDDVFLKAQQAVLYPFVPPLYDLETGQFTIECKRAFKRIFRMFDKDCDGLLSDAEWDRFQRDTFHFAIVDRDLAAWKKVLTRNNPSETEEHVLHEDKFTIQGFITMFDVFISQNRLDVVWQALRKFNYDDDLNLHIPNSILNPEDSVGVTTSSWKLSAAAKQFLTNAFQQFDSDKDGYLSPDDIITIFSVLPLPSLPPWHPMRAPELFEGCFSMPKESQTNGSSSGTDSPGEFGGDTSLIVPSTAMAALQHDHSMLSTSGVSILSASDSLPTLDVGGMYPLSKSLSYLEWMGYWHTISAISPSITRVELYRLGYVEPFSRKSRDSSSRRRSSQRLSNKKSKQKISLPLTIPFIGEKTNPYHEMIIPSREVLVTVLGKRNCGKTALLNALRGSFDASLDSNSQAVDTSITYRPETSSTYVKLKRSYATNSIRSTNDQDDEELVVHFVFMDVPESAAVRQEEHIRQLNELFGPANVTSNDRFCDLAMLVFDCTDASSLAAALDLEVKLLRKDTPRMFVATKNDLLVGCDTITLGKDDETVLDKASFHCRDADIEPPLSTSALMGLGSDREKILDHIARCALENEPGIEHLKSRPHEAEKRREAARRRKMLWLGGIVSVGVAVAVGVGLLLASGVSVAKKDQKSSFSWLRTLFGGSLRVPKDAPQA